MTDRNTRETTGDCEKPEAREKRREKKALTGAELAALVAELEATGDFRVLKRLTPLPLLRGGTRSGLRCAIVVDTETTGLILPGSPMDGKQTGQSVVSSEQTADLVSLAMVGVAYDPANGDIKGAIGRFHKLRQPSHPIPETATRIHGITDADVKGRTITSIEVAEWIAATTASVQDGVVFGSRDEERLPLIVAHNANYDRRILEALFPEIFLDLPWACSLAQVPWADHGFEGRKLDYLIARAGYFYGARHTALADADAVVELLRQQLGGRYAMAVLRESARQDTSRIYITTPYNPRTIVDLKDRGYRWSSGDAGRPKAWFWEGPAGIDAELAYLNAAGLKQVDVVRVNAFDRFSWRS